MKITLQHERPMSWNTLYAGKFWRVRAVEATRVHALIWSQLRNCKMFDKKVDIIFTAFFAFRPLDCDNLPIKLYIDGLKGKIIKDDDYRFVRSVKGVSVVDKLHPRVEIDIEEI